MASAASGSPAPGEGDAAGGEGGDVGGEATTFDLDLDVELQEGEDE